MKWALELEEFEVIYRPRIEIKGQALAEPTVLTPDLQVAILTWVL